MTPQTQAIHKPALPKSSVPPPPVKKNIKGQRSFVKMLDDRKYLIDGVEEFDDNGELVEPWREGNTYILVKPLKAEHYIEYYLQNGETLDKTTMLIVGFDFLIFQKYLNPEAPKIEMDEMGGYIIPEVGVLYGDPNIARTNLSAYILSCHGKIIGFNEFNKPVLEGITQKEVLQLIPGDFANTMVDVEAGDTAFYELLKVSTVFNPDIIEKELIKDEELKEDELKNLPSKNEMPKSVKKPSKTPNVTTE